MQWVGETSIQYTQRMIFRFEFQVNENASTKRRIAATMSLIYRGYVEATLSNSYKQNKKHASSAVHIHLSCASEPNVKHGIAAAQLYQHVQTCQAR